MCSTARARVCVHEVAIGFGGVRRWRVGGGVPVALCLCCCLSMLLCAVSDLHACKCCAYEVGSGPLAQRGTFKGMWLNAERTEWALEKEQQ
jgi:hypothetical protein